MPGNLYTAGYAAFVAVMRSMRAERGITQAELASRLDQPQSFVSKSERKERRIDVVEFIQITTALGFDPVSALRRVQKALEAPTKAKGSGSKDEFQTPTGDAPEPLVNASPQRTRKLGS